MMIAISKELLDMAAKKRQQLLVGATKEGVKISLAPKTDQNKVEKLMKTDGIKVSR